MLYLSSFATPRIRTGPHVVMIASVAATSTLSLCVVRFLDTPFSGVSGSIEPTTMRESLDSMESQLMTRYPGSPIPCDEEGKPINV